MKTTELRGFSEKLGGPGFLNPQHFGIAALILLLAGVSTGNEVEDLSTLALYALANLIALVVTAIPFLILRRIKEKEYFAFEIWRVVLTGLILGGCKSVSTAWLVAFFELENLEAAVQSRLLSGLLIGVLLVVLISAIPLVVDDYERNRAVLIRESVSKKLADSIAPISKRISDELARLADSKLKNPIVAERLEAIVNQKLRPISNDLWESTAKQYPQFRLKALAVRGFKVTPVPIWPMVIIYAIGSPGLKQLLAGASVGALVIVIQALGIILVLAFANGLKRHGFPIIAFVFIALGIALSINFLPDLFGLNIPGYNQNLGLVLIAVNAGFNVLLITTLAAGIRAKRNQDNELEVVDRGQLDLEAEEISRLLASRRIAEILHGQVQNRILAAAVRINSANQDYKDEIDVLLSQLRDLHELPDRLDITIELQRLKKDWSGVLDISWGVQGEESMVGLEITEALREAITNSHKHGFASKVRIELQFLPGRLSIDVLDDGIGPRKGRMGLGQRLLDSLGPWKLTELPKGGSRLTVVAKV